MGNLFTSTIGRKLIMSISGLFLILFLLFHMSMNIAAVFSTEAYNAICEFLGANWYALAGTLILAAGFVVHIIYASILTLHNRSSRGTQRYAVEATPKSVTWASRNMFVLGLVVVLGLLLHLYNFWYNMQFAEIIGDHSLGAFGPTDGAAYIADLFSNPVYCLIYLIWFLAIWFHLKRLPDDRMGQPDLDETPQMPGQRLCDRRFPRFRSGRSRFLPAQPVRRVLLLI